MFGCELFMSVIINQIKCLSKMTTTDYFSVRKKNLKLISYSVLISCFPDKALMCYRKGSHLSFVEVRGLKLGTMGIFIWFGE